MIEYDSSKTPFGATRCEPLAPLEYINTSYRRAMAGLIQFCATGLLLAATICQASQDDEAAHLLRDANTSYQAHRPAEAVRLYREYLARYPDRADVRVFLGGALFNLDKPDEALEEARLALALDKNYGRAYTLVGLIYAG